MSSLPSENSGSNNDVARSGDLPVAANNAAAPVVSMALAENGELAPKPPMRLGDKLVSLGLISADQLQVVLTEQKPRRSSSARLWSIWGSSPKAR